MAAMVRRAAAATTRTSFTDMRYAVRARGQAGIVSLTVDAFDPAAVRHQMATQNLRPLSIHPVRASGRQKPFPLALFSQELLALLEAGLTIGEAVEALQDKEGRPEVRDVLQRLLTDLKAGQRFSAALRQQPEHFPPLYIGLMQAAERTSSLPESLTRYLDYRMRLDQVRSRVVSALVYPAILAVVGGLVILFLLGYVVPRFAGIYQGTGRDLPWLSQWLMAWGSFAAAHGRSLALGALAAAAIFTLALQHWRQHDGPQHLARRIPGVAPIVATFELARLYLSLGTLLEGGLPVLQALQLGEGLLSRRTLVGYRLATAAIARGTSFSDAFAAQGLATPVALRLLRVGERGGRLGEMLGRAARFHDGEIARAIDLFARSFEPMLMAAIGLVVGLIVVLLYLPIFDLAGSLQ